jgi:hypothetical protein
MPIRTILESALAAAKKPGVTEPHQEWLRAVLGAAEPAEGRMRQFRAAREEKDEARRKTALEKLAAADDVGTLPVRAVTRLAVQLENVEAHANAARLLRRAQQQYPADFWVNHRLGWVLGKVTPPEWDEAVRFRTAARGVAAGKSGGPSQPGQCAVWQGPVGRGHRLLAPGHRTRPEVRQRPLAPVSIGSPNERYEIRLAGLQPLTGWFRRNILSNTDGAASDSSGQIR